MAAVMGRRAAACVRKEFGLQTTLARYAAVYAEVLSGTLYGEAIADDQSRTRAADHEALS
jgi:hypothetical protein